MNIEHKVALVTGASSGVGAKAALQLAQQGAKVIINFATNSEGAEQTLQSITAIGGQAAICQADISDDNQTNALIDFCIQQFGQLDIVINNAGTTAFVPHQELDLLTDDIWKNVLSTNLLGPFYVSRAAQKHMQNGGEIVMTSSIAGLTTHGSSIAYCASKAGLNSLTKTLAKALGEKNIRVNAICPGLIDGEWAKQGWGQHWQAAKDYTLNASAIKHISQPDDVAAALLSIITGPDNMTGQIITLDSGLTL